MRNLFTFFLVLFAAVTLSSPPAMAGDKNIVDDVLQIPKTTEAPVIDGVMDEVWFSVAAYPMGLYESGSVDTSMSFPDHFSTFRAMWDDEAFYVFVTVVDDSQLTTSANPWENDCVEIFFDGGNEKTFEAYDANDQQWRYVFGEDHLASPQGDGRGEYKFVLTDVGYNLELKIVQDSLFQSTSAERLFELVEDTEIGFEISNADRDNDTEGRAHVLHWWTADGNTWQYSNLFGTAILSAREISSVLDVPHTDSEPNIDGTMEAGEGWENSNAIVLNLFEGVPEPSADTIITTWGDSWSTAHVMWDENNFYVFVEVIDDSQLTSSANPWENDCIEIFFDGGNDKTFQAFNSNDQQWRFVFGEDNNNSPQGDGRGEYMFLDTPEGFNLELKIPQDSLFQTTSAERLITLQNDEEFGFEISNADRDNDVQGRSHVRHWWTSDGNTWQYANLFGTAILTQGGGVAVEKDPSLITSYSLDQNYPNPFNPSTSISYSVPKTEKVKLTVYNVLGHQVAQLVNDEKPAGNYTVKFDGSNLASGIYFYKLEAGSNLLVKKMVFLK